MMDWMKYNHKWKNNLKTSLLRDLEQTIQRERKLKLVSNFLICFKHVCSIKQMHLNCIKPKEINFGT